MTQNQLVAYTFTCLVIVGFVYALDDAPASNTILLTKCEKETAKLSCPNGTVISIELGNYGRFSVTPCNPEADPSLSTSCFNEKTTSILKQRCEHKEECSFQVSNAVFGDVCPETSKYLEVNYNCVAAPATTTTTTTTPIPTTTTVTEKQLNLDSDSKSNEIDNFFDDKAVKFCPSVHERELNWPKTKGGRWARISCPLGTFGDAEWFCSDSGEWSPKTGADLSRCVSDFIRKLEKDVEDEPENLATQLETLKEVHSHVKRHKLIGGELLGIQSIVEKVVNNYGKIMKSSVFPDDGKRGTQMSRYLMESMNHLLGHQGKDAWSDVTPQKQHEIASSLLVSAEKLLAAVFPPTTTISEVETQNFVAKPNIFAQAATVKVEDH
uniref:Latrophilin Cirl n=1 Tax=Panagrolaimus sp. JU765 TaxID=591449 RepID=A0AC34Q1N3_9BILA